MELINMLIDIQELFPNVFRYSDTAGLRQVQFLHKLKPSEVLKHYYRNEEF